jgi:hypothetical protein
MLQEPEFIRLAEKASPEIQMHEENTTARESQPEQPRLALD